MTQPPSQSSFQKRVPFRTTEPITEGISSLGGLDKMSKLGDAGEGKKTDIP